MIPGNVGSLLGESLGEYHLTALLGAGGMAEVYRAHDASLHRDVAVKVLPASLASDPDYVQRFRDEARSVAALSHPNIVPVYHYGEKRGLLFLVMPIMRESLRERMEREGRIPIPDGARIVAQIASALDAAHNIGLVHRDVKPENILLDDDGKALLTDFGIAREVSFLRKTGSNRTLASTGLPVGTPEYMAPEQLRADTVDQRADIYGLGTVLYELLTGVVPHEAETPYEVAALVLTEPPTPPSVRNPQVWPELNDVVVTALAKDPAGRQQNARAFVLALRSAILPQDTSIARLTVPAGAFGDLSTISAAASSDTVETVAVPVALAPLSVPEQTKRLRQRLTHRRGWLLAAALVVLLLAGICGGSGLAILQGFSLAGMMGSSRASNTPGAASGSGMAGDTSIPRTIATTTPKAKATGTTGAGSAPTHSASAPGATPTNMTTQPTATNTPTPPPLAFNPSSLFLYQNSQNHKNCVGVLSITNNSAQTVGWSWTQISPQTPGGFQTQVNGSSWSSQLPADNNMLPNATDTINIKTDNCNGQLYSITITDSHSNTYTIAMHE